MQEINLKQRTAQGLFWAILNSGTTQVLNLVIGIILARLLSPTEYGIVGVLTIFTAIAGDLQNAGFTQGLINLHKPTKQDYNSVFTFNVCMSVIMYIILFLFAPLIAWYFKQPCLTSVSRFVFLAFFISSLGIAHSGYMTKNMMNKEIAIISVVALVVSGVSGIILALLRYSYWALAWQQVIYIVVVNIGRYHYVKQWIPQLTFDFTPIRRMTPFTIKILVTRIISTISGNILTVIFGRLFPMHSVGNYSQAYKWSNMAHSLIGNTVGQLAQTVLVESTDEKAADTTRRELRVFRKMMRFTCYLSMPIMFGFAIVSNEFLLITVGEKWKDCVPMLRVLCISGAFMPLYVMYQNLSISQRRSDIYMWLNIIQICLQVAVILSLYRYGILLTLFAYSILLFIWLLPWQLLCGRLIHYRWIDFFKDVIPFTISASVVMFITYYVTLSITQLHLLLFVRVCIATALYIIVMHIAGTQIQRECVNYIIGKLNFNKRNRLPST